MNSFYLKDLLEIKNGSDHKHLNDGDIPVFGSGGLMRKVDTSIYEGESILLPRKGTLSNIQYVNNSFWTVDTLYYTIVNKDKTVPYFLYHYLKRLDLSNLNTGTGVPSMTFGAYYGIKINLPELSTQQKIADLLSALDDKIELNNKINAEFEAMAKTLYDYWFVQFDFPNAEGKPYKSSGGKMVYNETLKREIPEGWEVKTIGDVIGKIESGKRPKGGIDKSLKNGIPSLGAESIDRLGYFNYSNTKYIPFEYRDKIASGIIQNNDILIYKDGAYVGKTTLFRDNFPFEFAVINEHVFLVRSIDPFFQEYLLFTFMQESYYNIMQSLGQKAAQPGLNQEDLKSIKIIIPPIVLIKVFNEKIDVFFKKLFINSKQNQELAQLRDWLLPMLMNGQVSVE